jgi:hypothetical protein
VRHRSLGDRKDREHTVADEFQHLAAEGVNGTGNAVEPGIEHGDDCFRRMRLGQGREVPQVRVKQRSLDGLAEIAPQRRRQHPFRAALAEIGIQRRPQCGARSEHGERGCGKTRGLAQSLDFIRSERTRSDPAEQRSTGPAGDVFLHVAARDVAQPAAAGIVGRVRRQSAWRETERFEHPAILRAP